MLLRRTAVKKKLSETDITVNRYTHSTVGLQNVKIQIEPEWQIRAKYLQTQLFHIQKSQKAQDINCYEIIIR